MTFNPNVVKLEKRHDRDAFDCGKASLNNYLHRHARQDMKRRLAAVFVLQNKIESEVMAFYALSQMSVDAGDLTKLTAKGLPQLRPVPCTLLGQFAVDRKFKGQGIGGWMLSHVFHEVVSHAKNIASFALIVDAVEDDAVSYWRHCGFITMPNTPNKLFLSIKTIEKWISN